MGPIAKLHPIVVPLATAIILGAIAWGRTTSASTDLATRVTVMEPRLIKVETDSAAISAQLTDIKSREDEISRKLDNLK